MDDADRRIFEHRLALPVAKAVGEWLRKNDIRDSVVVHAAVSYPTCYVDENGVSHTGPLVSVDVEIIDDDYGDDD